MLPGRDDRGRPGEGADRMRHRAHRAWLVVALIAGGVAPPPRMADALLTGASRPAEPGPRAKGTQPRGRNRIGVPMAVAPAQAAARQMAPVVARPDRAPLPGPASARPAAPLARRAARVPFRLRC